MPGPCAAEQDLRGKSIEQKLAFANACSASFPCQALASHGHGFASGRYLSLAAQEECAQDFQQACPRCVRLRVAIVVQIQFSCVAACGARLGTGSAAHLCNMRILDISMLFECFFPLHCFNVSGAVRRASGNRKHVGEGQICMEHPMWRQACL